MNVINIQSYKTKLGELLIGDYNETLCLLDWKFRKARTKVDTRICHYLQAGYKEMPTPLHEKVMEQLQEYIKGNRKTFDIPLSLAGSAFQQHVWERLLQIPFGKTISYLELARQLGDEKAVRAVAAANGANAISIVVPCHRVVGSKGELTGYAGGIRTKKLLLQLEGTYNQAEPFTIE